ncbi:MAG: hypothetical protein O3A82_04980 [Verrucomicrobia bacterium]|nr:hypothetical protein [Verrucomicrobiota bacterium]
MIRFLLLSFIASLTAQLWAEEEAFRPEQGNFPPIGKAKAYRGELVFVDHVNRRGSLRLFVDGYFRERRLHHFAMLPYGMIYYRGAPADLRDVPLGTILYGEFFLPCDPKLSAVPNSKGTDPATPAENHAILLEDDLSFCLRQGKAWKLRGVDLTKESVKYSTSSNGNEGHLMASLDRKEGEEGLGGEHRVTIDGSTRIWRGRELLGIDDLIAEGLWQAKEKNSIADLHVQLALTWHPRYLYQEFHTADLWLNEAAVKVAQERQRQRHIRFIRLRWMPAWVDAIEYGNFGDANVTVTLFGGMDESLYADFKPGSGGQMAAAENTLRTYWPDHDGMEGKIVAVEKTEGEPPFGSSGIQVKFSMNLILEGFRPGRIVRIRPNNWPKNKPPKEELIGDFETRWPSPDIFKQ